VDSVFLKHLKLLRIILLICMGVKYNNNASLFFSSIKKQVFPRWQDTGMIDTILAGKGISLVLKSSGYSWLLRRAA